MIWLFCSIAVSTLIFVIFKYFDIFKIDSRQALIVNYLVAFALGALLFEHNVNLLEIIDKPWFSMSVFIGFMFLAMFALMIVVVKNQGVSILGIAVKMSVIFPVLGGIFIYNESTPFLKMTGIVLALIAVVLVSLKPNSSITKRLSLLPIVLFIGTGLNDVLLKYSESEWVTPKEIPLFTACLFLFAALWGLVTYPIKNQNLQPTLKNILAGILLGIPNFGTIFFLLKALKSNVYESSALFPINNIGIVLFSIAIGVWVFKEPLSNFNKIGLGLGILSIVFIAL